MTEVQPSDLVRKTPVQERARKTIETILEATAQILVEEGGERLTTNHLARKAGFSIGTIYQYFPNKEAIVLALIEQQREEGGRRIQLMLDDLHDSTVEEKIRMIVRVVHGAFAVHRMPDRRLALALLQLAVAHGLPTPPNVAAKAIAKVWMEARGAGERQLNDSDMFVLTSSVIEVLRQATLQRSPLLGTPEFEDAILRMVVGFLRESVISA